jgi:hypothetical protein
LLLNCFEGFRLYDSFLKPRYQSIGTVLGSKVLADLINYRCSRIGTYDAKEYMWYFAILSSSAPSSSRSSNIISVFMITFGIGSHVQSPTSSNLPLSWDRDSRILLISTMFFTLYIPLYIFGSTYAMNFFITYCVMFRSYGFVCCRQNMFI